MHELCDATMLEERDLEELFSYLAVDAKNAPSSGHRSARHAKSNEKILHYEALIEHIRCDGDPADRRSVLRMLWRMQAFEESIETRLEASMERKFNKLETS